MTWKKIVGSLACRFLLNLLSVGIGLGFKAMATVGLLLTASTVSAAELVSANSTGTDSGDNFSISPEISADGRFVAFESAASDLVPSDTDGLQDAFVRDLQLGTTTLVSVNTTGTGSGNNFSISPVISADGRFVAFVSGARDLVATETNGFANVFVRDLQLGTTTLVSRNSSAFESTASGLVATDTNGDQDVFVWDLQTGTTTLVSSNSTGTDSGNRGAGAPVISADGRFVAFSSASSDLVATDTNGFVDVFVRDLQLGTTTLVSSNSTGTDSGNYLSFLPAISADGRFVAFESGASDLVATDTNIWADVFVRDLQMGITTLVSSNSTGTDSGNGPVLDLVMSANGRSVAFVSTASDLVATDTNGATDVFALVNASEIISSDVSENVDSGPGDTVLITNDTTVSGNVAVDGGEVIIENGSTIEGNVEATNGGTATVSGGASVTGNVAADGATIGVTGGSSISGNVEAANGATVTITDSTIDGNVLTENSPSVTIVNSTIVGNIVSIDDGIVTITDNTIDGNLEISSPTTCIESNNAVGGNNWGCP